MTEILNNIYAAGDEIKLKEFLKASFPHVIKAETQTTVQRVKATNPVFEHFDPKLLTIPRRHIISATDHNQLELMTKGFISDKLIGDYIIVDNNAYIEYLTKDMEHLISAIPNKNWLIRKYRSQR